MKSKLWLYAVLALFAAGCRLMEPRPTPADDRATPGGPAPAAPPVQTIPDTGTLPALPPSTHIVVGLCPSTGTYNAMGVNTETRSFTFQLKGGRATQQQAFTQFYASRAPVTVYTQRVKLRGTPPAPSVEPSTAPPSPSPMAVPRQETGSTDEPTYDPCADIGDPLPEPTPKPTGSQEDPSPQTAAFQQLSWYTAHSLAAVSELAPRSTAPGTVPR
ncbi:hypothetical protein [Hyalangium sp.]|uniref:hypothetical protein n=1 Tax=Hyalangium sp. TaxID=2028555 RepID=UPI002D6A315B|nr:hypothetical protein [Hyalangium sp.]HYI00648.1 hypothetical protein [Hyalangium sp.]